MRESVIFDSINNRIVTKNDEHILYTNNLTCPNEVIEKIVYIINNTKKSPLFGPKGKLDEYLLHEENCSQDDREKICEKLFDFFYTVTIDPY